MLSPFTRADLKNIKPASLEIPLEGRVVYWDEERNRIDSIIHAGRGETPPGQFTLFSNSIAFVQVKPRFQLPDYIAIRFNLRITHVYRGLLLGTGPLVDPGYQGHLYIPLHNLTDNDYVFSGGEGLLWMEFTKLQWDDDRRQSKSDNAIMEKPLYPEGFEPFPVQKLDQHLEYFFGKAYCNQPILSSIPQGVKEAKTSSKSAEKFAESAKKSVELTRNIGLLAGIGIMLGLLAMFVTTWNLAYEVKHTIGDKVNQLEVDRDAMRIQLNSLSKKLSAVSPKSAQQPQRSLTKTNENVQGAQPSDVGSNDQTEQRKPKSQ